MLLPDSSRNRLLGFLVFGDVPGTAVLAGAAIVVGSGLYLLWRERNSGAG